MKLLSFFQTSKDKLTTTISSNHQYVGAVLIDWTNFLHSCTPLYGSDKRVNTISLPNILPFVLSSPLVSFSYYVSFICAFLSFLVPCSYYSLCLSQETLIFSLRGGRASGPNTFVSRLSFQHVIQNSIRAHIFTPYTAYMYALGCRMGTHQIGRDWS